jgi:hypothetical protein
MVAAAGEREEKDRGEKAHASGFYCRIVDLNNLQRG